MTDILMKSINIDEPADKSNSSVSPNSGKLGIGKVNGTSVLKDEAVKNIHKRAKCHVSSKPFIMYYLMLLFLLCFATPVLITTSLNVFIQSAVVNTTYAVSFTNTDYDVFCHQLYPRLSDTTSG